MIRTACLFVIALFSLNAFPAFANSSYYQVAAEDVAKAVGAALAERGAAPQVKANLFSANDTLYEANKPLSVAIEDLAFHSPSQRWQAKMRILSKGETVTLVPIQGRYEPLRKVPVLKRRVGPEDVIAQEDIAWKEVEQRQLRKDTVAREEEIIGKSPRHSVSPDRPVRLSEIEMPDLVKKGAHVSVSYTAANMRIQTVGEALENGAKGSLVRIQNVDTKRAFTARVVSENQVEANMQTTMTN